MHNFCESDTGVLYWLDGLNAMQRWDGLTAAAEAAGLTAPASAVTVGGSSTGGIVGSYYAYVRYKDKFGYYSNLSPISTVYTASGSTGSVTAATFAAPIQITSVGHGLSTNNIVKITGVGGNTSANGTWTITKIDNDNFTLNSSSGNAAYIGAGTWISGVSTIAYTNVPTTSDTKVTGRQILRNTDGQTTTFYVDVDTTDLVTTSFNSTNTDTLLAANESQAILDSDGLPLANLRTVPPTHKTTLAAHLSRLFMAGQYDYTTGMVSVTNGSATVTGIGTNFVSGMVGRYLYIVGAATSYLIDAVDTTAQTLTLHVVYAGTTDQFGVFAIRAAPAERKLVYFTPAGQPESWPAIYALSVQEDGDEITGLMPRGSFLYIIERRHIYKFTYQDDPLKDGAIFLAANRGCVNNRCHAIVDNDAYMLDEYGIHKFTSAGEVQTLSEGIQEIFKPGSLYGFQINWNASPYFFCVVSRPNETIRWFVTLGGDSFPRHAIAYNYRLQRWWIEQYPFNVGAGLAGHISRIPYSFLAGESKKVYAITATTDVASPALGTIRGTVTSYGLATLTDSTAAFSTSGVGSVVNAPVTITDRTGKGQTRRVVSATATQLTVDMPWTKHLDTTSVYQVGGVVWNWKSTWLRLSPADVQAERQLEVLFQPTNKPCTMDLRTRNDFGDPDIQKQNLTSAQGGGIRTDSGQPDKVVDLTRNSSVVTVRLPGYRERFIDGRRYFQVELSGVTNEDAVAVFEIVVEGMGNSAQVVQQA